MNQKPRKLQSNKKTNNYKFIVRQKAVLPNQTKPRKKKNSSINVNDCDTEVKKNNQNLENTQKFTTFESDRSQSKNNSLSKSKYKISSLEKSNRLKNLANYSQRIRKNNKNVLSHQNSQKNLHKRLPWGVDEPKLTNYVMETLTKMHNLRRVQNQADSPKKISTEKKKPFIKQNLSQYIEKSIKPNGTPQKLSAYNSLQLTANLKTDNNIHNQETSKKKIHQKLQQKIQSKQNTLMKLINTGLLTDQFQCIEKNNFILIKYRIMKSKRIQLEIVILKKIEELTVTLRKGSLRCQSIDEKYKDLESKTSLFLMLAIQNSEKYEEFRYPQLHITINEKNGTFAVQKHVIIPYSWLHLIEPMDQGELRSHKIQSPKKIKSKSILQNTNLTKKNLQMLIRIFQNNYVKYHHSGKNRGTVYNFGYRHQGQVNYVRLVVSNTQNKYTLECETNNGGNPAEILKILDTLLQL